MLSAAINLQLLEPAIATHICEARQSRAWRFARLVIVWFAVCLFATAAFALDPQKAITQFVHTAWTEKDGAPADIVAITQTKDGYLWLGTWAGLFSFDGIRFARFEPQAGEYLPAKTIRMLLATRDGSLWIVFYSGSVSRLLNGHVTSFSERDGLPAIFSLVECKDGSLIAGTAKGLARFKGGIWKDVTKEWNFPGKQARLVYFDRAGTLWVLTEDRIVYHPSGQKQFVDPAEATGDSLSFAEAPDGAIWISETGRSAHTVRRFHDRGRVTEDRVFASRVLFDRNGGLWVSSIGGEGLRRVAHPDQIRGHQIAKLGRETEQYMAKDGLSGNYVWTLFEDREGNIWSGSTHGLDRFRESAFTPVSIPEPDAPRGIVSTSDGSLWTFGNNGILRIGPRGDHEVVTRSGANSMFEDESGVLWLGSDQMNASRFQQGRFVNVIGPEHPLPGGVALKAVVGITRDREGGMWLADLDQGLFRLADGVLTKIAAQSEPFWDYLYTDRRGRVWMGQNNHVVLYDHGKSKIFGTIDGVPPGPVCTIYQDRAGNVWAGGGGGLSKFENGRFRPLSKSNGLPPQSVFGMAEDDEGYWWISADVGVLRIPAGELVRAVANPAYRIRYESFNMLDGLPGMPQSSSPTPVVARTRDGRIWFETKNGIAYVDPRRIPKNDMPPPVHVETVIVGDKVLAPADGIVLPHNMKDIEIDYTALSLSIPERVLFRYKLEGNDTEWQEPGTRRQAFYNGLRPRKYKFRVIACNDDGVWNEEGATLDFRVAPAWYQTIWFRASCVAGFVLLLWALYQLRLQHLQRQFNMTLEARVGERTRIARELHDTLIQSVDGLMLRIETALTESDPKRSRLMIEKALDSADEVMLEGRQRVNALRAEATAVKELSEALASYGQDLSKDHPATFSVALLGSPKAVDAFVRDEAYCIGREALGNAFQHADATKIELEVTYDRRVVHMRVRDDGYGIDEQTLTGGRPGHWGLRGMRERAQVIGGKLVIWSRPGVGTEIDLEIPADLAYEKGVRGLWSYWMKRLIGDRRVME